jgi:hypothetical protein
MEIFLISWFRFNDPKANIFVLLAENNITSKVQVRDTAIAITVGCFIFNVQLHEVISR